MIKCPNCKAEIDEDSKFCDQCGKEIMYCPECKEPKKGTSCPRCGEDLITAKAFFTLQAAPKVQPTSQRDMQQPTAQAPQTTQNPQPYAVPPVAPMPPVQNAYNNGGTVIAQSGPLPLSIIGNGWCLPVKEGRFGRSGGIYREFSIVQYISGSHGEFRINGNQWEVQDIGSTNGTFLNGSKLIPGQWYPIKKGDTLKIATITFSIN